jgi:hypothetical protein
MATTKTDDDHPKSLPLNGCSRWADLEPFIPVCRETWRKLCIAGKAPQPVKLSLRCTVWKNSEIHTWLSDPLKYTADVA